MIKNDNIMWKKLKVHFQFLTTFFLWLISKNGLKLLIIAKIIITKMTPKLKIKNKIQNTKFTTFFLSSKTFDIKK